MVAVRLQRRQLYYVGYRPTNKHEKIVSQCLRVSCEDEQVIHIGNRLNKIFTKVVCSCTFEAKEAIVARVALDQ